MNKKRLSVMIVLTLVIVIGVVCVRWVHMAPDRVAGITVRNGLSGNLFEITEQEAVLNVIENLNGIGLVFGLPSGAPGYCYTLTFYGSDGSVLDTLSLVSESEVGIHGFTGYADVSKVLEELSTIEREQQG